MNLAHLIDDAIEADTIANTLTINVGVRFTDTSLKQVLINTWGAIEAKNFRKAFIAGMETCTTRQSTEGPSQTGGSTRTTLSLLPTTQTGGTVGHGRITLQ